MSAPTLYLLAYLAECGEEGWTDSPNEETSIRLTRGEEVIEVARKMSGWAIYRCPEHLLDVVRAAFVGVPS